MAFLEADTQQHACRFRNGCEEMSKQPFDAAARVFGTWSAQHGVSPEAHRVSLERHTVASALANVDVRTPFSRPKDGYSARYNSIP